MFILVASPVYVAQTENSSLEDVEEEAGVTPDNGFMWGMERAMESVSLGFTFNKTKKAQKSLEYANERVAEAQKMAEENKSEASEKAMKNWEKNMNSVEQIRKRLQEKNKSQEAENITNGLKNAEMTLERVRNRIMNDDNPNNDNALQGLDKALGNVRKSMGNITGPENAEKNSQGDNIRKPEISGNSESDDVSEKPNTSDKKQGKFDLMVSDAPADIEDFDSLVVSFTKARIFKKDADSNQESEEKENNNETENNETNTNLNNNTNTNNESNYNNESETENRTEQEQNSEQERETEKEQEGFYTIDLEGVSVDLTEVVGDDASEIASIYLDEGIYNKIELHASDVKGIVDGEEVDVKIPSEKLMITKTFIISAEEPTDFVFDINVVKKGNTNRYNLLPVISESGVVGRDLDKVNEVEKGKDSDDEPENNETKKEVNISDIQGQGKNNAAF